VATTQPRRKSKDERHEEILQAAFEEFAERGLHAASTEDIARRAGISQPYVFRIFGTKKALFIGVVARCFRETHELFARAAEGKRGTDALEAMGNAYVERLRTGRTYLLAQMQAYVACDDPEIREVVQNGYGDLVAFVERIAGDLPAEAVSRFFATGMLLNVVAAMGLGESTEPWVGRLLEGSKPE
jgi:AcrR family transcriptional regulator